MNKKLKSNTEYQSETFKETTFEAGQIEDTVFSECVFKGCSLRETVFINCRFNDCLFDSCDLSLIRVQRCEFRQTDFRKSRISGVDWTAAIWSKFTFRSPLSFHECDVSYSTFIGLALPGIEFTNCTVKDVEFSEANLTEANFQAAILTKSHFRNTNLTRADFTEAREYALDLMKTTVTGAKFSLPEAYSLLHCMSEIVLVDL